MNVFEHVEKDKNSCPIQHTGVSKRSSCKSCLKSQGALIHHMSGFSLSLKRPYHYFQSYLDRCWKEDNTQTGKHFNRHLALNCRQRVEYYDDATHLLAPLSIRIFIQGHAQSSVSIIHNQWVETEQLCVWLGTSVLHLVRLNST